MFVPDQPGDSHRRDGFGWDHQRYRWLLEGQLDHCSLSIGLRRLVMISSPMAAFSNRLRRRLGHLLEIERHFWKKKLLTDSCRHLRRLFRSMRRRADDQ